MNNFAPMKICSEGGGGGGGPPIANYHYGDVAKIDSLISLGISVGLRVDFPNDFRGFTMCSAGQ